MVSQANDRVGQRVDEQGHALRARIGAAGALASIEQLVAVGDRFAGADGDLAAAELVRAEFRTLGLEVVDREFSTLGYRHTQAELSLVGDGSSFEAIPPYFSPPSPPDGIQGELVFVEGGEQADYDGLDVAGKIVVMQEVGLGYSRFWLGTFAALAARRGAAAMVVIHPLPWPYRMSMEAGRGDISARFCDEQLPVVCVSGIDGGTLRHAIGAGRAEARLVVQSEMQEVTTWNVSGVLGGSELSDEVIVIHAHRDHGLHPGANDNGSGFGTMMEIARALADTSPRRSIEFLCTTAEEGVTPGIAAYIEARHNEGALKEIRGAIDLDMFGVGGKLNLVEVGLWPDTEPLQHTEWLMRWVEGVAVELGYDVGRMTAPWGVAESGRFLEAGVPAIWFWRPDDFYYHSTHDSVDKLDGNALKAVADITAISAWQMANADELPAEV